MLILLVKFYISIFISLFLPGYFFSRVLLSKESENISFIERVVFSFGFSLIITNFLVILLNFLKINISAISVVITLTGASLLLWFISRKLTPKKDVSSKLSIFKNLSKKQLLFLLLVVFLSSIMRTFYVADGIVPKTTDLGHHIYWSKTISQTGQLPNYGMPDFIIGEHIIFTVVNLISGFSYISAMPVVVLFLVNIFSLLAILICSFKIVSTFASEKVSQLTSLFSVLVLGLFYALSSPQAKFIAGGVIGNTIGNLFIPLAIFFLISAIKYKSSARAIAFYLMLAGLAFTHHLSTFIFLYVFIGFFVIFGALALLAYRFNLPKIFCAMKPYFATFLSKYAILVLFLILIFSLGIHTPSYLNKTAVDTAVGAPSKSTRFGLPLSALSLSVGAWRLFYAFLGFGALLLISFRYLRKKTSVQISKLAGIALLASWFFTILLMSTKPGLLKVDIISSRIVSYITFPLSILSALFISYIFTTLFKKTNPLIAQILFFVVLGTGFVSGFADISDSVRRNDPAQEREVLQTFKAASYLNNIAKPEENVLKDHIYLEGDTWMKLFFMKGYKYPLSRSFLKRYNDPTKNRETCTRDMIAIPNSEIGRACFADTGVKFIVLKRGYDDDQFERSSSFSKLYSSATVVIYQLSHEK